MSGLQLSMEVKGLDTLMRNFSKHQPVVLAELKAAETKGLTVLRDEARHMAQEIAIDGRLPNSVRYETIGGGLVGMVGSLAPTALNIEQGTIAKMSVGRRAALLQSWVARKGLGGETVSVKSHRRTSRSAGVRSSERDLAWRIAIAQEGQGRTKKGPLPFIIPAARNKAAAVQTLFQSAAQRIAERLVRG